MSHQIRHTRISKYGEPFRAGSKKMIIEKSFVGKVKLDGDDPFCYGEHLLFDLDKERAEAVAAKDQHKVSEMIDKEDEVVSFLDKIAQKYYGKRLKITIRVEEA